VPTIFETGPSIARPTFPTYIFGMNLLIRWILNAVALLGVAWVMSGHGVHLSIRPGVILLTLPINLLTLGLFTLFINAACFSATAWIIEGFDVTGFWGAFFGALLMSIFSAILSTGIKKD
jgi:putative membrane protein